MASPRTSRTVWKVVFVAIATTTIVAQRATPPTRSHHPDIPYQSPTSLGAASYAKILCSAVFVSGDRWMKRARTARTS